MSHTSLIGTFSHAQTKTCGDVYAYRAILLLMDKEFGMRSLFSAYLGIGSNVVEPWARGERKSIGAERSVLIQTHEPWVSFLAFIYLTFSAGLSTLSKTR